jgi:peptide/nickel transport system ATP-binding protein
VSASLTAVTPLLAVQGLQVGAGTFRAVDDVSFTIMSGEILALVGESGSGKTATGRVILGLLPPGLERRAGSIRLGDEDLTRISDERLRELRGGSIGMVFQEPMVSLNPAMTIGRQLGEALALHSTMSPAAQREACLAMLRRVQIPDPEACLRAYPHEFSGGMRQRIMLAAVMLPKPKLLIADEPTTALDNLAQAEILNLMVELARDNGTAVLLVTHNLGLVARYADRALVMQRGRIVKEGNARQILREPREEYTRNGCRARRGCRPVRRCSRRGASPSIIRAGVACSPAVPANARWRASISPSRRARPSRWWAARGRARPRSDVPC